MKTTSNKYHGHRFPTEVISHGVWLYYRLSLSLRDVEELLAKRGITVTHETIRQWCRKFGPEYARKLRSYGAAHRRIMPSVDHNTDRYANNLAEVSHQPTRQRERQMRGFKSAGQAQRFLSVHSVIRNLFNLGRHQLSSANYRLLRERSFKEWSAATAA
jgi:putative transposase